jgi:hypothetical protein
VKVCAVHRRVSKLVPKISRSSRRPSEIFNEGTESTCDGSQFDRLFKDGEALFDRHTTAFVIHTLGHTPACTTHVVGNAAFTVPRSRHFAGKRASAKNACTTSMFATE